MLANVVSSIVRSPSLSAALVHPSSSNSSTYSRNRFQRHEVLGDAVLNLVVLEYLMARNPKGKEGMLSRRRAKIVCGPSLAAWARRVNLHSFLDIGRKPVANNKILEDCAEALIGAYYQHKGLEGSRPFVEAIVEDIIQNTPNANSIQEGDEDEEIEDDTIIIGHDNDSSTGGGSSIDESAAAVAGASNTNEANAAPKDLRRLKVPHHLPLFKFCERQKLGVPEYTMDLKPFTQKFEAKVYVDGIIVATVVADKDKTALNRAAGRAIAMLKSGDFEILKERLAARRSKSDGSPSSSSSLPDPGVDVGNSVRAQSAVPISTNASLTVSNVNANVNAILRSEPTTTINHRGPVNLVMKKKPRMDHSSSTPTRDVT